MGFLKVIEFENFFVETRKKKRIRVAENDNINNSYFNFLTIRSTGTVKIFIFLKKSCITIGYKRGISNFFFTEFEENGSTMS